ncbi:MAG: hypothetical protein C0504_17770 [Candidatus Solibacter sp.]|nr:hypothetical protein [Candidatus Solibacter sp.]
MPKIVEEIYYDGAKARVERLGLSPLVDEIKSAVTGFTLTVKEETDANGGAAVRKLIDAQFSSLGGWTKKTVGDIDWTKCKQVNGTRVCVGVEVQVSARSDLLVIDMIHLTAAFREGRLDAGVVIVPSDRLGKFLTDRGPCMSDAKKHANTARLEDSPLILFAIEHDSAGPALAKQQKASFKQNKKWQ